MTLRTRFLIAPVLSFLFLILSGSGLAQTTPRPVNPPPTEEVVIEATQQEKVGDVYHLRGNVVITVHNYVIRADEINYNADTGDLDATGHLVFDGGPHDEHIEASHATYNRITDSGKFYDVVGSTGAKFRGSHVLLTSSNPFAFKGKVVEKVGRDLFIVHDGLVTDCRLERPKWTFQTQKAVVLMGENAKLYHATFHLAYFPIFYFPYTRLPVERLGRQSGLLIPGIGQSSLKGTIIGESFYWAVNRSLDATIGAEYYSAIGWAQHGEFRSRPSENSFLNATYFGVLDRNSGPTGVNQGGEEVKADGVAQLPWGFRGVANIDYLSSYLFRQTFSESFTQATNSTTNSIGFASKSTNGYYFNVMASRYQNFQSTTPGDLITILHAPSLDLGSVERPIGTSPVQWSYDTALQGVSRSEPGFQTDPLVGRFDFTPRASLPLHFHQWSIRPEVSLDDTYYTQGLAAGSGGIGIPGTIGVNRKAIETEVEIRPPALDRIFEKPMFNHRFKHVIEPRVVYRYVTGVSNFQQIIRFDARDILTNTNELEYSVTNRLYAKPVRTSDNCVPQENTSSETPGGGPQTFPPNSSATRTEESSGCSHAMGTEIFSWELIQKYFMDTSFGGALVPGQQNVFTTTAELTGIAFLTAPRHFSPIVSRMRAQAGRKNDIEWHLDYDPVTGQINASTAYVTHHFDQFFVAGSTAYVRVVGETIPVAPTPQNPTPAPAPLEFNQFRWLVGYGNPNKRGISAATNIGFDVSNQYLQYAAIQSSYNWDCCGISVEFRRLALGSVRNENQYRFALSLTNIGTFGNMRRQERLF
jgi:LPS-assembly protein